MTRVNVVVLNNTDVALEKVTATYEQHNWVTTSVMESETICENITLQPRDKSKAKEVEDDTSALNKRTDNWKVSFFYEGKPYNSKTKKCGIAEKDKNGTVELKISGKAPKFEYKVEMPKSSSCTGSIE